MLLLAFAGAPLFSIFVAELLLAILALLWLIIVVRGHETVTVPSMFWPLLAFGACTLVSSVFSIDQQCSFVDSSSWCSTRSSRSPIGCCGGRAR